MRAKARSRVAYVNADAFALPKRIVGQGMRSYRPRDTDVSAWI